ncbi:MAG: OB-fold nucleic acid binding domain-containing protein, partial [Desulfobacterales bacterium]
MEQTKDIIEKRHEKARSMEASGIELYPNDFQVSHTVRDILAMIDADPDQMGKETASFHSAGRIMAVNRFGKSAFIRFRDRTGQLQAYVRQDKVGNEAYALFKQFDMGDFIGLVGTM